MFPQSERELFQGPGRRERFDADSGRRILERAAAEQYRRQKELDDGYSLEELREMATEAGISEEALQSVLKQRSESLRKPKAWSPRNWLKSKWGPLLAGLAAVTLLGLMLASPTVAYFVLGVAIAAGVLVLLGVSPV